ncbi:MAG TPA: DUF3052 domain-containing protein [Thermoanaerobaculia bacterium]|jgi:hypothetical protein|nr:DUF3052 domain-containing protein [Thermoanaerobaculia bacterium]
MPGYSGTPLVAKLGIKEGAEIYLAGAPENYLDLVAPLPEGVKIAKRPSPSTGFVHHFTTQAAELGKALAAYRNKLGPEAIVWISWPKKSAKVPTDVTEDTIRELALPLGWVDVKVCAVTEVWSGLKLVVRKELR